MEFLRDIVKLMCVLMFAFGVVTASNVIEAIIEIRRERGRRKE